MNQCFSNTKRTEGSTKLPPSEESGRCDCISDKYQLDFKLIASKTILQARSILSEVKAVIAKGWLLLGYLRCEGKNKGNSYYAALRDYNFDMLCELRENYTKKQGIENDIYELLETEKILIFSSYKFDLENEHKFLDGVQQIQGALKNDFQCAMQYQNYIANGFDTYMAFIYDKLIVFMEERNNVFDFIDFVELAKSPVYQNL